MSKLLFFLIWVLFVLFAVVFVVQDWFLLDWLNQLLGFKYFNVAWNFKSSFREIFHVGQYNLIGYLASVPSDI